MRNKYLPVLATLLFASNGLVAAPVYTETNISLDLSLNLAKAAVDACTKAGHKVSVAVLDNKGVVKAQATADGAFLHSADASRMKAYTSISRKIPSGAVSEHVMKNSDYNTAMNFIALGMSTWGGGLPITYEGAIVGAIGVSGAPSGPLDTACATAALEQAGLAEKAPSENK